MPNPMEILETGVTIGTSTSTGTASAPAFDCAYPANFTGAATFTGGVAGINKIKINNKDYILRMGETGAEGYLTFVIVKNYINQIPLSINSNGSEYVGTNGEDGYKTGIRLNSSGAETTFTDWEVTGFIPVTQNAKVYFSEIDWNSDGQDKDYLALYDSNFNCIGSQTIVSSWLTGTNKDDVLASGQCSFDSSGNLTYLDFNRLVNGRFAGSATATLATMAYFRISACGITDNSIIAINTPIE